MTKQDRQGMKWLGLYCSDNKFRWIALGTIVLMLLLATVMIDLGVTLSSCRSVNDNDMPPPPSTMSPPNATPSPTFSCGNGIYRIFNDYEFCDLDRQAHPENVVMFTEALAECTGLGLQLVQIHTKEKNNAVATVCGNGCTWLGLTCSTGTQEACNNGNNFPSWVWGDGTPLTTTFNGMAASSDGTIEGVFSTRPENCAHWWNDTSHGGGLWAPDPCARRAWGVRCVRVRWSSKQVMQLMNA